MATVKAEVEKKISVTLEMTAKEAESFKAWIGPRTISADGVSYDLYEALGKALSE